MLKPKTMPRFRRALALLISLCVAFVLCPTPFANAAEQPATAVIIDASGSMLAEDAGGQTRMDAAKQATQALIRELPSEQKLALLTYGTETGSGDEEKEAGCRDVRTLVPLGGGREDMENQIGGLNPRGYTPIGAALLQAERELPKDGPRQIVLVSDGIDTCAPPPVCEVAKEIRARGVDVVINVIGLNVDEQARAELQCVAQAGGGTYADAKDAASLTEQLVLKSTRSLLKYEPGGTPVSGTESPENAPLLEVGGLQEGKPDPTHYLDTSIADKPLTYKINLQAGERVALNYVIFPPDVAGNNLGEWSNTRVEIRDAHGNRCMNDSSQKNAANSFDTPMTGFAISAVPGNSATSKKCEPGDFYINITRENHFENAVELPMEFMLWKLPDATTEATQDATAPTDAAPALDFDLADSAGSVPSARGPSHAQLVQPGVYDAEIVPGETLWFKVDVQEGQQLQLKVQAPPIDIEPTRNSTTSALLRDLKTTVLSPVYSEVAVRANKGGETWSDIETVTLSPTEEVKAMMQTPPLLWGRTSGAHEFHGNGLSGEQYVGIRYNTFYRSADESTQSFPVKFKLGIETLGEAGERPAFTYSHSSGTVASTSAEHVSTAVNTQNSGSYSLISKVLLGLLGVGIFAAIVLGAFLLLRRKH